MVIIIINTCNKEVENKEIEHELKQSNQQQQYKYQHDAFSTTDILFKKSCVVVCAKYLLLEAFFSFAFPHSQVYGNIFTKYISLYYKPPHSQVYGNIFTKYISLYYKPGNAQMLEGKGGKGLCTFSAPIFRLDISNTSSAVPLALLWSVCYHQPSIVKINRDFSLAQ